MRDMGFQAVVESLSHEGGLIATFSGASPALNTILIRCDDQTYVGKVDGVIGRVDAPKIHIAHLDHNVAPESLLTAELMIRPKKEKPPKESRGERNHNSYEKKQSFQRRDNDYSRRHDDRRRKDGNRFGSERKHNFQRRDNGQRDHRDNRGRSQQRGSDRDQRRSNDRRGGRHHRDDRRSSRENFTYNDWTCKQCSNSNFSFREKCNRCDAPRQGNAGDRSKKPNNQRSGQRDQHPKKFNQRNKPQQYRKSRGKGRNHAHNKPPKDIGHKRRRYDN